MKHTAQGDQAKARKAESQSTNSKTTLMLLVFVSSWRTQRVIQLNHMCQTDP